jgi:hypothetical protein
MNALLGYIYHGPPNSGADYHYTATDIVMAALIIVPGVVVWVSFLFAGPIQDSIAFWWGKRKEHMHPRFSRPLRSGKIKNKDHKK